MHQHNFGLDELDNMMPWEREIYLTLLQEHVKAQNERMKKGNG
jgi:hypothetical protein